VEPSCQSLIEIKSAFVPVPLAFKSVWGSFIVLILLSLLLRRGPYGSVEAVRVPINVGDGDRCTNESSLEPSIASVGASRDSAAKDVRVSGINVIASDGTSLLDNVDISLKAGTVNALCGRSGSGKTTL
jgi:ABC-type multidrug transport system fused ATPase/permease subunit